MRAHYTRLFVDCDGTLVLQPYMALYQEQYGEGREDEDLPNEALIQAIAKWAAVNPAERRVIVWSGGGAWYAERWAQRFLGGDPVLYDLATAKDFTLIEEGDIVVDDEAEADGYLNESITRLASLKGASLFGPAAFVREVISNSGA